MNKEFRFFSSQLPGEVPPVALADTDQEKQGGLVYGNTPPSVFAGLSAALIALSVALAGRGYVVIR